MPLLDPHQARLNQVGAVEEACHLIAVAGRVLLLA
jgi:hypothetical protein